MLRMKLPDIQMFDWVRGRKGVKLLRYFDKE